MSDDALLELAEHIALRRPNEVVGTSVAFGELTVEATLSGLVPLLEFLRSDPNCRFSTLIDITAVDHPARPARFDVVYHLLSMYQNQRIRVKAKAREASRQKKMQIKAKLSSQAHQEEEPEVEVIEISRQHPLPWILLGLSWLAFACLWFWLR